MRQNSLTDPCFKLHKEKSLAESWQALLPCTRHRSDEIKRGGDPGILSDFTLSLTQDDDKFNLRDITDFFFDPSDPLDYATLGLLAFPLHLRQLDLQRWESVKKAAEQVSKMQAKMLR